MIMDFDEDKFLRFLITMRKKNISGKKKEDSMLIWALEKVSGHRKLKWIQIQAINIVDTISIQISKVRKIIEK